MGSSFSPQHVLDQLYKDLYGMEREGSLNGLRPGGSCRRQSERSLHVHPLPHPAGLGGAQQRGKGRGRARSSRAKVGGSRAATRTKDQGAPRGLCSRGAFLQPFVARRIGDYQRVFSLHLTRTVLERGRKKRREGEPFFSVPPLRVGESQRRKRWGREQF